MTQPTYKLYYFDVKALGESIRMLFAYGGIEYEDIRVAQTDWPELKSSMYFPLVLVGWTNVPNRLIVSVHFFFLVAMPMGQMPVLEVDGKRVSQSMPIARHIAKRVGLAGDNDWEELLIDSVAAHFNDYRLSKHQFTVFWFWFVQRDLKNILGIYENLQISDFPLIFHRMFRHLLGKRWRSQSQKIRRRQKWYIHIRPTGDPRWRK